MLPDAAETVLGIFGFDRTLYGKARNTIWWDEIRKNRRWDYKRIVSSECINTHYDSSSDDYHIPNEIIDIL